MDELPELPFEQILSYLCLSDLLKARAVSSGWYQRINCRKVKSLCFSERPSGFVWAKKRLIRGVFVQNFISSSRIDRFFATHASTILSDLKHLRLCNLNFNEETMRAVQMLNSLGRLEELDIFRFDLHSNPKIVIDLKLPMLRSVHLKDVLGVEKLILDSPGLQRVELWDSASLELVHGESVERLLLYQLEYAAVKNLKNLKELHIRWFSEFDSTLLSSLKQLKELHLHGGDLSLYSQLFEQKRRYNRTDLKIYRFGCLLDGPEDPLVTRFQNYDDEALLVYLAENPTRLVDEIPLCWYLPYSAIEHVALGPAVSLLKRFTDLNTITADEHVQDTERFLDLLNSLDNIVMLVFTSDQPQELFERLPEHCAIQELYIQCKPSDLLFLCRLKHLIQLDLVFSIDLELIRKILEQLPFLTSFRSFYRNKWLKIDHHKRFQVFNEDEEEKEFVDLDATIRFVEKRGKETVEQDDNFPQE